jgi:iron complex outermembrane receptor protein
MKHLYPFALMPFLLPNLAFGQNIELESLDFESLMGSDVQLSSVMKRLQTVRETAASVYVLTGDEILNSGVSSIPQALTLVPGVQVRQIDNNLWAIGIRATAGLYSSKLLVLVDGRSVYDPIHAGVNWQTLNIPLFDVDKIEVVRGQGALLWGSNATNGVINIITKHSEDTRGTKLLLEAGSEIDHNATLRYGSELGDIGSYRISGQSRYTNASSESSEDIEPNDDSQSESVMGRVDLNLRDDLFVMLQGEYQEQTIGSATDIPNLTTNENEASTDDDRRRNYNLTSRIEHAINHDTSQMAQISYSGATNNNIYYIESNKTLDIDYQVNSSLGSTQLDWGVNYRYSDLTIDETDYVSTDDEQYNLAQYGAFLQAQFEVIPDQLKLSLANKSEYNEMTGWEHQPMARAIWTPNQQNTLWASVSRGARIPSILEYAGHITIGGNQVHDYVSGLSSSIGSLYIEQVVDGNEDVEAEISLSKELGYRYSGSDWGADIALFHTHSDNVIGLEHSLSSTSAYTLEEAIAAYVSSGSTSALYDYITNALVTQTFTTDVELETYGGEFVLSKQFNERTKAEFGYSYIAMAYSLPSDDIITLGSDGISRQLMLKVSTAITNNHTLMGRMRYEDGEIYDTDDFYALDLSWTWRVSRHLTLGLTGNNLFNDQYLEYGSTWQIFTIPTYAEPSVTAKLVVSF